MSKKWILVIDSGIGGLYTLNKIKLKMPNENFLYFMDTLHSPYGNKSRSKLKNISNNIVEYFLKKYDIKLIVLACNTLSSICYEYLKLKYFNIPIVKIEPINNETCLKNKPTLILATKNTIKHNQLIKQLKKQKNIYCYGFRTLAKKIDNVFGDCERLKQYLYKKLVKYKNKNIKNIILGCTHFNYIKKQLKSIFGKNINFVENSENVASQVYSILKDLKNMSKQKKFGRIVYFDKIS